MRAKRHVGLLAVVVGAGLSLVLTASCGTVPGQTAPVPAASTGPTPSGGFPTPSGTPTETPTPTPSDPPSPEPSRSPSPTPTKSSATPSQRPSQKPSEEPSQQPSKKPNDEPRKPVKPTGGRTVYLTFDDGPSRYTGQVLDILARYDAKATFFVIGQNVGSGSSLVRRARQAGHSIQNHTWDHPDLRTLSSEQIRSQIQRTDNAIRNAGGGRSTCVRPPYGATNSQVRSVLRSMGKRQVLWDIDTLDWQSRGSDRIYRSVIEDVGSGSVVLTHDGGGARTQTVAALPRILKTLTERGYKFGALCD